MCSRRHTHSRNTPRAPPLTPETHPPRTFLSLSWNIQFHFSKLDLFMSYVCVSGVTFGSALIMALIVESPLTKLGRRLENIIKPRERYLGVVQCVLSAFRRRRACVRVILYF